MIFQIGFPMFPMDLIKNQWESTDAVISSLMKVRRIQIYLLIIVNSIFVSDHVI